MPSKTILIIVAALALLGLAARFSETNMSKDFGSQIIPLSKNSSQDTTTTTIKEVTETTGTGVYGENFTSTAYTQPNYSYPSQMVTPPPYIPPTNNTPPAHNNPSTVNCPSVQTKGMWVWDSAIYTNENNNYAKRKELLSFVSSHNINTLYMESYDIITGNRTTDKDKLADFIKLAGEECINIELLAGESEWYLPSNHSIAVAFAEKTRDFAEEFDVEPKAIHLDVEPYGYNNGSEWDKNNGAGQGSILSNYISMLSKVKQALGNKLLLNVDVPFWYDSSDTLQDSGNEYYMRRIMDAVDIMTLMDYRDTAFGVDGPAGILIASKNESKNGIYDLAYDEVSYANSVGKKVIIGVETQCFSDPDSLQISFCGTRTIGSGSNKQTLSKGATFMNGELAKIRNAYNSLSGFGGTAIHHYKSYLALPSSY